VETEKEGAVQSDGIEEGDEVQEVVEETPKEVTEAPKEDKVQDWEPFNKLISEREKAAEEKAKSHFQSIKDKEVAAEKRARLDAERQARLAQAHVEAQRELLLAGLVDPQERAEAERRYNAKVAEKTQQLNQPSPEQMAEFQRLQVVAEEAKYKLRKLRDDYDIDIDVFNLKTSHPDLKLATPDEANDSADALLKKLKVGKKPAEEPKAEEKPPKKAPKVDEGGSRGSSLSNDEFIKKYSSPGFTPTKADHERMNKILTGG
jgi:hypothetical protein